jgi:hypothetical protein
MSHQLREHSLNTKTKPMTTLALSNGSMTNAKNSRPLEQKPDIVGTTGKSK